MVTTATERLAEIWEDPPGLAGFIGTVDHKRLGKRYIITSILFLVAGGIEALLLRIQLGAPNATFLSPEAYNQIFTMHGTTMIFLYNTPVVTGFGIFLVPLMIGTRDMAFPKLNALGYWIFLFSGLFLYSSFLVGYAPDGGWFAYAPLTGPKYSVGPNLDFWALGIVFLGVATTIAGINFVVTIFKMRAPGMSIDRMPLFVWSILVMGFMILFSLPAVSLGALFLQLDRMGMHFFDSALGGSPILYQHLFWIWGHPEVYILFLPATGMASMIIPTFSRQRIAGYTIMAASLVAVGLISFGVWVHHMFAVGLPLLTTSFFGAVSLLVAIPSGAQIFAWLITMWRGKVEWKVPMLFSVGFIVIFVLGGITGVMVGIVPFDWQVHDSYFVVAHFHYVLLGGVVFPVIAGLYYWYPKMTGRMMSERLGKVSFWLMFAGFNVTFFPQHILGLLGMPRRIWTYRAGLGWDLLNAISTVGAFVLALGFLITFVNVFRSRKPGMVAGPNPWGAESLEWSVSSPPPEYNFATIPIVDSREPLWQDGDAAIVRAAVSAPWGTTGEPVDGEDVRETPETSELDAGLESVVVLPGVSNWPFAFAVGLSVVFAALLLRNVPLGVVGAAVCLFTLGGWQWHSERGAP